VKGNRNVKFESGSAYGEHPLSMLEVPTAVESGGAGPVNVLRGTLRPTVYYCIVLYTYIIISEFVRRSEEICFYVHKTRH